MLVCEACQREQEWRFLFLNIFFCSRDIQGGLFASPYLVKIEIFSLQQRGAGAKSNTMAMSKWCQFVSYLAYIIGSKFEQHHSNIS